MICRNDSKCKGGTCDQYGKCHVCGVNFVFFTDLPDPDNWNVKPQDVKYMANDDMLKHNLSQYNDIPATKT